MCSLLLNNNLIKGLPLDWPRDMNNFVRKYEVWMRNGIKPSDVTLCRLNTKNNSKPKSPSSTYDQGSAYIGNWSPIKSYEQMNYTWMSADGLDKTKLVKHPLQHMSHHTSLVSEPSRVKIDPLKQTYLTMFNVWGHVNPLDPADPYLFWKD